MVSLNSTVLAVPAKGEPDGWAIIEYGGTLQQSDRVLAVRTREGKWHVMAPPLIEGCPDLSVGPVADCSWTVGAQAFASGVAWSLWAGAVSWDAFWRPTLSFPTSDGLGGSNTDVEYFYAPLDGTSHTLHVIETINDSNPSPGPRRYYSWTFTNPNRWAMAVDFHGDDGRTFKRYVFDTNLGGTSTPLSTLTMTPPASNYVPAIFHDDWMLAYDSSTLEPSLWELSGSSWSQIRTLRPAGVDFEVPPSTGTSSGVEWKFRMVTTDGLLWIPLVHTYSGTTSGYVLAVDSSNPNVDVYRSGNRAVQLHPVGPHPDDYSVTASGGTRTATYTGSDSGYGRVLVHGTFGSSQNYFHVLDPANNLVCTWDGGSNLDNSEVAGDYTAVVTRVKNEAPIHQRYIDPSDIPPDPA